MIYFVCLFSEPFSLRVLLWSSWSEANDLQERCGKDFHIVVYLYERNDESIDKRARQNFFSRFLIELKASYPDKVLLLPMAVDVNVSSVDIIVSRYGVNQYPAIVFDDSLIIDNNEDLKQLNELANFSRVINKTINLANSTLVNSSY